MAERRDSVRDRRRLAVHRRTQADHHQLDATSGTTDEQLHSFRSANESTDVGSNLQRRWVSFMTTIDDAHRSFFFHHRCYSLFGKAYNSGAQDLSLQLPGCVDQGTVIHELIHAVGFAHEQARPDRDQAVTINWQNIQTGQEYNFQAYSTSQVNMLNKAYDLGKKNSVQFFSPSRSLGSIMHYRWNAFSKNGQATVLPKQAGVDKVRAQEILNN